MLAVEEDMTNRIHDIHDLRTGNLCIGGSHYINAYIMPETMAKFSAEYPGIRLELVEASSALLADMLNDRLIDLTFSCREDLIARFEHYPAFKDNVLLSEGNNLHDRALQIFAEAGITPRIKLEISQLATSYHLARDRMIGDGEEGLCFYKVASPAAEREFYAVMPGREYTSKAVRAFIEMVRVTL